MSPAETSSILLNETLLTLSQAARRLPPFRAGRPVNPATLTRWILSGAKAPNGTVVRLEAIKTPSGWRTSEEALARFFAALTPDLAEDTIRPAPRTPMQRQRASERAAKQLERAGA
jgi:hypothetical protein